MRSVFILFNYLITIILAAKLEDKSKVLKREPITYKDGLPVANIQVGTPPQDFSVVFDTSNSLTWVPSIECNTKVCHQHSQIYNANSSSTSVNFHKKVSIKYDEGVCMDARLYHDTLRIAGISLFDQPFGSAYSVKGLGGDGYLGSFGLGVDNEYSTINRYSPTYTSTLSKRQNTNNAAYVPSSFQTASGVTSMQFSMVAQHSDGFYEKRTTEKTGGVFIFGIDHDVYQGEIAYLKLPNDSVRFWKTAIRSVQIGRKSEIPQQTFGYFNTGSRYMLAPPDQADSLHRSIKATFEGGFYRFETCDDLPSIKFDFNGYRATLPSRYYTQQDDRGCYSLIRPNLKDSQNWVLGNAFLNHFYHIYDIENKQMGLAVPKNVYDIKIDKIS